MENKRKKQWIITAIAFLSALIVTGVTLLCVFFFSSKSDPLYVAHRGFSGSYVGNTAPAFRAAVEKGFYGIETDIRFTSDGVMVCNHDKTVKYADGDEKTVLTSSYQDLVSKPLKNDKTEEEVFLCTYDEYLAICKQGGARAFVELKDEWDDAMIAKILKATQEADYLSGAVFIAFDLPSLLRIRAVDPKIELQYLSSTKDDPNFERCLEEKIDIDVEDKILTRSLVSDFHDAGLKVNVWTINKKIKLISVRNKKVDYVTTDVFYNE